MIRIEDRSVKARNDRLYEELKRMGLFVAVTYDPDDHTIIDYLTISAGKPQVHLLPLEGTEVAEDVPTTVGRTDNVINFPPED